MEIQGLMYASFIYCRMVDLNIWNVLELMMRVFENLSWTLNPMTPKSYYHLISPYNITTESNIKVMRIREMITKQRSSWLLNKFSLSAP